MKRLVTALLLLAAPAFADEAKIETSMGDIVIALDAEHAPKTVANFVAYAKSGHFNGTVVYRVVPGFVVQMGSVDAKGNGRKLRAAIPLESANGLKNVRGAVAMARADKPASAQAEFFVDLADNTPLDPKPQDVPGTTGYAVFGAVIGGMDVVDAIAKVALGGGKGPFPDAMPKTPVKIVKVTIGRFAPPSAPPTEAPPAQNAPMP